MTTEAIGWAGVAISAALVGLATIVMNIWSRSLDRNIERATEELEEFIRSANAVLDDVRTPYNVAEIVVRLSQFSRESHLAKWVTRNRDHFVAPVGPSETANSLNALPPDLSESFTKCVVMALFISASADLFVADRLRVQLVDTFTNQKKRRSLITQHKSAMATSSQSLRAPEPVKLATAQHVMANEFRDHFLSRLMPAHV